MLFNYRTPLPTSFCVEVSKRISEVGTATTGCNSSSETDNSTSWEDHTVFTRQHDEQLLQWLNKRPQDWSMWWGGGGGVVYGWGHNHRGQLGGVESAKVKLPTVCDALSSLRPARLLGGEQTLLAVTHDGKLYATGLYNIFSVCSYTYMYLITIFMYYWLFFLPGYGAGGRLGIGGTDSVLIPTLLESIQHVFITDVCILSLFVLVNVHFYSFLMCNVCRLPVILEVNIV